jgi:hypothetical protein
MLCEGTNRQLFTVDRHAAVGIGGLVPDGRQIVNRAQHEANSYLKQYGEIISPEVLTERVAMVRQLRLRGICFLSYQINLTSSQIPGDYFLLYAQRTRFCLPQQPQCQSTRSFAMPSHRSVVLLDLEISYRHRHTFSVDCFFTLLTFTLCCVCLVCPLLHPPRISPTVRRDCHHLCLRHPQETVPAEHGGTIRRKLPVLHLFKSCSSARRCCFALLSYPGPFSLSLSPPPPPRASDTRHAPRARERLLRRLKLKSTRFLT